MRLRSFLVSTLILLAPVAPAVAEDLPAGFERHRFNASQAPSVADGVVTFHVIPDDCSDVDYGDGRGESDCLNGNVKSIIRYERDTRLGESVEYRFDLQMDPSFAYAGEYIPDSLPFRPEGWDSTLRIASWEGPFTKNFIYMLKADTTKGITFLGRQCQAPDRLGEWVSFSLKIRWANDERGWVLATCDGVPVHAEEGAPTTRQTQCYLANECQPGTVRDPQSLNFILGLAFNGYGHEWEKLGLPSPFRAMQADGITMRMRNISLTRNVELYGADDKALVVKLQTALNALGCDVGKADGVPGKRTREQALLCRKFAEGAMPLQLNVATLQSFVDLYSADGVADLPPGELPPEPLVVHVSQAGSENDSLEGQMVTGIEGTVSGVAGVEELGFLLIGEYNAGRGRFDWLNLLLLDDIGKKTGAGECPNVRVEDWGDGGVHAVIDFTAMGTVYLAKSADCLISKLPENTAREADFVLSHFGDIANSMVNDGTLKGITHPGLKGFMEAVAAGDITVRK